MFCRICQVKLHIIINGKKFLKNTNVLKLLGHLTWRWPKRLKTFVFLKNFFSILYVIIYIYISIHVQIYKTSANSTCASHNDVSYATGDSPVWHHGHIRTWDPKHLVKCYMGGFLSPHKTKNIDFFPEICQEISRDRIDEQSFSLGLICTFN